MRISSSDTRSGYCSTAVKADEHTGWCNWPCGNIPENLLYGHAVCNALQLWFGNFEKCRWHKPSALLSLISGIVNVLLNLFFVIVCDMSVAGVGIATVIADGISAGLVIMFLIRNEDESIRVNPKKLSFKKEHLIMILKIGAPAGIQGMVFSISNVFIQTA